jgi:hypothetical protein
MKNIKLLSLVVLALGAVACDPYEDVKRGTPSLLSVTAADFGGGVGFTSTNVTPEGTATLDITCQDVCDLYGADPTDPDADEPADFTDLTEMAVFVTFDRQFDGNAVQTSVSDCEPTGGWLSVSPAPAAGEDWYSCYSPASPTPDEGGSIVVFSSAVPPPAAPPLPQETVSGWSDFTVLSAAPAPIVITGSVAGRTLNVTVNRVDTATCPVCPAAP